MPCDYSGVDFPRNDQYGQTVKIPDSDDGCGQSGTGPDLVDMPFGWEQFGVAAGFSGRSGGVSPAPYDSLNLSFQRADQTANVMENHRRLIAAIGHESERTVRARQVHGARVATVNARHAGIFPEPLPELDGVDALLTDDPDLLLLTSHADCVPVYLLDPVRRAVGLVHAGWGGVLAGVVEEAVSGMRQSFGTNPGDLRIGIGPHIRACCFEVKDDVSAQFQTKCWWDKAFLSEGAGGKTFLDLEACLRAILKHAGVPDESVRGSGICTCCERERFFSHRGSGGHTGTGNAWIMLHKHQTTSIAERFLKNGKTMRRGKARSCLLSFLLAIMLSASGCSSVLNGFSGLDGMTSAPDATEKQALLTDKSSSDAILIEDRGPAEGGTLRLFMQPPDSLDPLRSLDPYVMDYGWFLYDPLVAIGANGQVIPFLADSLRSSQEGRIWDVTIRENVQFHDGTELTAKDVAFSVLHAKNGPNGGPYEVSLSNLDSAEAIGRDMVRLILKAPDRNFSDSLGFPVLPAHAWNKDGENADDADASEVAGAVGTAGMNPEPVGTGAYRFSFRDDGGITLSRNADWWNISRDGGIGHPIWPESVRFVFGSGEADRVTFFQQRRIDVSWTQLADKSRYMNRTDIEYREYPGNRMEYAIMGTKGTGIRSPAVRTLLLRYLAGCAGEEDALAGEPVMAAGLEGLSLEEVIPLLEAAGCKFQQPGQERRVLSIPGTSGWRQASLVIRYDSLNLERLKTAEWMTDVFGRLGVTVTREEATKKEEQKLVTTGQFDMMLLGCVSPVGMSETDMIAAMRASVGGQVASSDVMPLYRERRAMLYSTLIRGEKRPTAGNVYGGWPEWYLLRAGTEAAGP